MRDLIKRILLEITKWDYNNLKDEALKYKTKTEFFKKSGSAYNAAKTLGIFDEITKHMPSTKVWTLDDLKKEAEKYNTLSDFQKNSKGAYLKSYKLGVLNDITKHMTSKKAPQLNTDEFVKRSKKVHGDQYDYSNVNYVNNRGDVNIICPIHGEFSQQAGAHMSGQGCPKCRYIKSSSKTRLDVNVFIDKSNDEHDNRYTYDKVDYKNSGTKVIVTCPLHGDFLVTPRNHMGGSGCPTCFGTKKRTTQEFIDDARKKHGDRYDYTKSVYRSAEEPIEIQCKIHGPFLQIAGNHIKGDNCPKCMGNQKSNTEEFIKKSKEVHGDKYDYSKVEYTTNKKPVLIICPKHGEFQQQALSHVRGGGCPLCGESRGERLIANILNELNVKFTQQMRFKDCTNLKTGKYCRTLPFDFYLPDYNTMIEYDGLQHFKEVGIWGGEKALKTQQVRDQIKNQYCEDRGITMLRIPYTMKTDEVIKTIKHKLGINETMK